MIYNDSFMDNVTSIIDLFSGISGVANTDYSQFLLGYLILFSFFVIFLILSLRNEFLEVLIVDSFLTTLIAIIMYFIGMVDVLAILIPFVTLIIAIVIFMFLR